ncbi:MAG TPA: PAS domain S-box protein, partial [Anaerolineae bacterium]|nr:PAS domain S-box protein [Anaerolineae bacterium]
MTNRSVQMGKRLGDWRRSPRGGALIAAAIALAVLLPVWLLAISWYKAELLNAVSSQRAIQIFEVGGVIVMMLIAGLVYLSINRQAVLWQAVQQRTREVTRINQQLEEDLAQRQRVEAELRASEARSQALLNAIPDMMFRMNRDGTFLDYHADESDMVLPSQSVIGGNIRQLPAPPGVVDRMLEKIASALHTQQIQTLEYSLPTVGGPKDFEARLVADGPNEVVAIVRDVTARQQAEHSLHRWAHIFEHAEWGVAIGSADGRTLEMMNPKYAKMHGYTVEELSGRPIGSVFAPGTAAELSELIRAANETGHAVIESTHIRKDGSTFPVLVDLTAVKNDHGQLLYRVANVQDITERKQAADKLRTSEAELRALFAAMPDVILVLDAQGRYLRIAPTTPSFSRRPTETLIGQTLHDAFPPDEAAEFLDMIHAALQSQRPVQSDYSLMVDGELIWYTATISPLPNDMVLLVARDITARKRSEEASQRSQQQYEQLVNSIDGIVWEGDAQTGLFTFVSPAAERILGYPIDDWLTDQNFWADHLHPDDRQWVVDYCAAETAALRPHECEYRMLTVAGRSLWLRETVTITIENDRPRLLRGMLIDITARKQAEEALREREEQYRSIFEASLDGLFINSLDGYVVDVNPAGARMHGYTVAECRGLRSERLVHPAQLDGLQEFIEAARLNRSFRSDGIDVRKDGSSFPIEVIGTQFMYRGQPHALAIVRDITERVQTERALQERELQYRSVFESSIDGLAINHLDGQLVEFNPAMAHMHGYTVDEFRQMQPQQFIHPDSLPLFAEYMEIVKTGREYRCRAVDVRKDGSLLHVDVVGTPFVLRGQPHAFAIVRDISAQVAAEQALRDREEQYRSVFEAVSDGLFIDTSAGEMIDFNPAVARMHGYDLEEFRTIPTMQIIHPDSLHLFGEFVEAVKAGREYRCRAVDVRKDGSLFPVEVTGVPITYRSQPHMLAVLHDITNQVQAEQLLEQRVTERTRELSTLLDVSRNVASTLELEPLLGLILDALKVFVDYTGARIYTLEGSMLRVRAARGVNRADREIGTDFPLSGSLSEEVFVQRRVLV